MAEPIKVVIIAPYWMNPQHLGSVRTERFLRWLHGAGVDIVLVAAATHEGSRDMPWGRLLTLRDPLGIYREPRSAGSAGRSRPGWLRWLAYALLSPDPGVLWARRVARHPLVLAHASGAAAVLSSSFPESVHVTASRLAAHLKVPLVVDLRDGWLDEPMKPLLRHSALRRWREARLERRVLEQAALVLVTSVQWQRLLLARLPQLARKTLALTNACPVAAAVAEAAPGLPDRPLTLLYAGRIFTSRAERRVRHLLAPLLDGLQAAAERGRLLFVGDLSPDEAAELGSWRDQFAACGWDIEIGTAVPREQAMQLMRQADGLLLLSSSHASIPAKLFEYVAAQRPILAMTPAGSAVAELTPQLRQLHVVAATGDTQDPAAQSTVQRFITACRNGAACDRPPQFEDASLRAVFLAAFGAVLGKELK